MKKPQLLKTKDYSKFTLCQFNRDVRNIKKLRKSMEAHGFRPAHPLDCVIEDGCVVILDGHHRFVVARELGIEVYYVICPESIPLPVMNGGVTKWTQRDYVDSHARNGCEDYIILRNFHLETKIPLAQCVAILAGDTANTNNRSEAIQCGTFKVRAVTHANSMKHLVLKLREIGVLVNNTVIGALSRCLFCDKFSVDTFITRASRNSGAFKPCRTVRDQMLLFEAVYNYNSPKRIPLAWEVDEAMRKRSCIKPKPENKK